jgi:ferredoxin
MRVSVDFDLCESNALCEGLAPHVFELDDDDLLQVRLEDVEGDDLAAVRRAVAACPKAAISLVENA